MYPVVRVEFEETSLTVSESQESVEICVNSISPGIEENFTVNITSDIEGMMYSLLFLNFQIVSTGFFQIFHQFEILVNSSTLSDFQCYNQSYDFTSSDICSNFTECDDIHMMLELAPDENSSVLNDSSPLEIVFELPHECPCLATTSSSTSSLSLGDAGIAAVTLGVLVALTLLATTFVLFIFFYRERRKKS